VSGLFSLVRENKPDTFFFLPAAVDYSTFAQVVGRQLDRDAVAGQYTNVVFPHLARDMRGNDVPVLQLNTECRVWQGLGHDAFHL